MNKSGHPASKWKNNWPPKGFFVSKYVKKTEKCQWNCPSNTLFRLIHYFINPLFACCILEEFLPLTRKSWPFGWMAGHKNSSILWIRSNIFPSFEIRAIGLFNTCLWFLIFLHFRLCARWPANRSSTAGTPFEKFCKSSETAEEHQSRLVVFIWADLLAFDRS